jgi:hypothetical protein
MHHARVFFRFWGLLGLVLALAAPRAQAVQAVPSLYGAVVAATDAQSAAQDAMREVLVRLTGMRDAAADPALAGLITDARHYVQSQRSTTAGSTQVLFDAGVLRDAIAAAGRSVWGPDRPLVWVQLPSQERAEASALRAHVTAAAQTRGLPILIAGTDAVAAAVGGDAALSAARRAGANVALTAQLAAGNPPALQWTLTAPSGDGHWTGAPELAIDAVTDALVQVAHQLDSAPVTELLCHVTGVSDLASFAAVVSGLRAAPEIASVTVRSIDADSLTLQLRARGGEAELAHALASERLRATGGGTAGVLEYRYQAAP